MCCRDPGDCLVCVFCRDPGDCLSLVPVWFGRIGFWKGFWSVVGSDGFQTQEEVLGVGPGQGRKNSGRSNHNRWQEGVDVQILFRIECVDEGCKRCYHDIPAGLHGKKRQADAAKSGVWSTSSSGSRGGEDRKARSLEAENKELRARIDAMEKEEGAQKEPCIPFKEGVLEEVWGHCMEVEVEAECRRKLDEQRKKMRKELREVDRLSFVSPEMQESLKESRSHA